MWQQWVNGILGVWVIILALFGLPAVVGVITGIVIALLGFSGAAGGEKKA